MAFPFTLLSVIAELFLLLLFDDDIFVLIDHRNLPLKFGQNWVSDRCCCWFQNSSLVKIRSSIDLVNVVVFVVVVVVCVVVVDPRNLPLKFGWNRDSNSWDIADIKFVWWVGVQSHFHVKPSFCYVRLSWIVVELGSWQLNSY